MYGPIHRRTGPVMTKATTRLVDNAVGIYAPGHARYNEVDLFMPLPTLWRGHKKNNPLSVPTCTVLHEIVSDHNCKTIFYCEHFFSDIANNIP